VDSRDLADLSPPTTPNYDFWRIRHPQLGQVPVLSGTSETVWNNANPITMRVSKGCSDVPMTSAFFQVVLRWKTCAGFSASTPPGQLTLFYYIY
jgi:hypothetical protein